MTNLYKCDICGRTYESSGAALKCERRGRKEPLKRGLIWVSTERWLWEHHRAIYVVNSSRSEGHDRVDIVWDNHEDSRVGEHTYGFDDGRTVPEYRPSWSRHPKWRETIDFVRRSGIEPKVMLRGKVIPLSKVPKSEILLEK